MLKCAVKSICLLTAWLGVLCGPMAGAFPAANGIAPESLVSLCFGADINVIVRTRLTRLLSQSHALLTVLQEDKGGCDAVTLGKSAGVIAIGETTWGRELIDTRDLLPLGPEGFVVRNGSHAGVALIATRGNPLDKPNLRHGNIGAHFGAYALLGELGFGFLKPLAPVMPESLSWPRLPVDIREKPYWPVRATHLHTQHPLELTDMLQGWGPKGIEDQTGFDASLDEWESYVEWLLANRQNRVEWALLWAKSWKTFADSQQRIMRLKKIVDLAHAYGIAAGIDAPLALMQQHSYRMITIQGALADELLQIHKAVDWLMLAGFDFISTETGTSEFSHPSAAASLAWMNELASYTAKSYGKNAYIKVHCSTGQRAPGYPDPATGRPINFNMLPHYAIESMGVLPHTVQFYGLDDPAPTYGNDNFAYIRDFLHEEAGRREVLYYPETAYWVSYDIDVPLFLPVYGERRLHDLRLLAGDELAGRMGVGAHAGGRMDGQLNFASGWEWGYWFNEVITARAAWDPQMAEATDRAAFLAVASSTVKVFGTVAPRVAAWIYAVAEAQHALLIEGRLGATAPKAIALRNGQAYLEGFDTWDDISTLAARWSLPGFTSTQPARLELAAARNGGILALNKIAYRSDVAPLLAGMEQTFLGLARQGALLAPEVPAAARGLFDELLDSAFITALRARQQHALYDYAAKDSGLMPDERHLRLTYARQALDDAAVIVKRREAHYALKDRKRITSWRGGPTSYHFGYLWTVHSLYYWWRDELKAVGAARSACFLNIINPVDTGLGEGRLLDFAAWLSRTLSIDESRGCLDIPAREPTFQRHAGPDLQNPLAIRPDTPQNQGISP